MADEGRSDGDAPQATPQWIVRVRSGDEGSVGRFARAARAWIAEIDLPVDECPPLEPSQQVELAVLRPDGGEAHTFAARFLDRSARGDVTRHRFELGDGAPIARLIGDESGAAYAPDLPSLDALVGPPGAAPSIRGVLRATAQDELELLVARRRSSDLGERERLALSIPVLDEAPIAFETEVLTREQQGTKLRFRLRILGGPEIAHEQVRLFAELRRRQLEAREDSRR